MLFEYKSQLNIIEEELKKIENSNLKDLDQIYNINTQRDNKNKIRISTKKKLLKIKTY